MSNNQSKFITLVEPTANNKTIEGKGGNGSDIIQLQSYLTDGSNAGLIQKALGGEGADIFNVNFELPGDGKVGIDFNTGNLKAMAQMLVEPDWDVRAARIALDTAQAVTGFSIDVAAAAVSSLPFAGAGVDVAAAGAHLALDLAGIAGHAALDIEEYNNNLAGIDEFFADPERQDWGSVNVREARTVVEIRDFQIGIDTITLPVLPNNWTWQTNTGFFSGGQEYVSLTFKNGTNVPGEVLRIGFKNDRVRTEMGDRPPINLINALLHNPEESEELQPGSRWSIGKFIRQERSTLGDSLEGTVAGDFLSIDAKNNEEKVTLLGELGDDILIGRLDKKDSLNGGEGNDYFQPGNIPYKEINDKNKEINDKIIIDDTIDGGEGYDRVDYSNLTDRIAIDSSKLFNDRFKSIEGIIATEHNDEIDFSLLELNQKQIEEVEIVGLISLEGREGNDTFQGSRYDDFLDGGTGTDSMEGGLGDDVYIVDNPFDEVIENPGEGTDKVESSVDFRLENMPNIENLTLTGFTNTPRVILGTGNDGDNILKVKDISSPGLINATFYGNGGNDTISGGAGEDALDGGYGDDSLNGGTGNDYLYGYTDNDELKGGIGKDTLDGGTGNDILNGGTAGADYFSETIVAKDDNFTVNDWGWSNFDRYPRHVADVNGDGRADIVGFGLEGVYTALGQADGTFGTTIEAKDDDFTVNDQNYSLGWGSFDMFPRQLADVNGDGRADIVGFALYSVGVSLGQADGTFGSVVLADDNFGFANGYFNFDDGENLKWGSFNTLPRQVADVNGDGRSDIVAFGMDAVYTALGQADGTFGSVILAKDDDFTVNDGGWTSFDRNPRHVADINGDGRADIVGFGLEGVYTALGQADGTFGATIEAKNDDFTVNDANYGRGWSSFNEYPRQLGDVNGDGRADIVGFADDSVGFALGQEDGTFSSVILAKDDDFTFNDGGWESFDRHPRHVADVNGDGRADIVGFGDDEVKVSLSLAPVEDDLLTGGEGVDTFVFDSLDNSYDVITDFSHAEGDKIQIGSEFGTISQSANNSRDLFSYDSGNGELSFDGNHFATLNTDSGFNVSEDIVF